MTASDEKMTRRMDAYYYGFTETGLDAIDKILGAVACAGKAFHHTNQWYDEVSPYDDHTGGSPIEWIQNAAFEASAEIAAKDAEIARLQEAPTAQPSPDVAALVDDAGLLLDAYKAVLVLHRVMEKHGLTAGASAAENIADRIVAAHPEFPGLSALRGSALARVKGGAA